MKKIEIIWRELLFQAIEKKNRRFTQKDLAKKFRFSTSTIFQSLKIPRRMGAVKITGRFFILEDPEKLLYHWASVRNLEKDLILKGKVNLPILEIEGQVPPQVIFGGYSAFRQTLKTAPADYDKVLIYAPNKDIIEKRFKIEKGRENLFIFKADKFLANYGPITPLAQTFVDLWNLSDWYAKEFTKALKKKIDELLP